MPDKRRLQDWIAKRAREDDDLYQRYASGLEPEHRGEFVAISQEGQLITGSDELTVAKQALQQFGPGSFALRRIGEQAEIRWRRSTLGPLLVTLPSGSGFLPRG
ncbi:MAG: hypothetical protein Q8O86_13640 [Dehalococcoidia bacterium]|nr:hypothetical protein [Dehalococcoidia bacterium]